MKRCENCLNWDQTISKHPNYGICGVFKMVFQRAPEFDNSREAPLADNDFLPGCSDEQDVMFLYHKNNCCERWQSTPEVRFGKNGKAEK